MKRIPYGIANFEKIRESDYYYVDHTRFIRELEKYETPVFLRPRRFGKSLWCSTLECYYDINRKDKFKELFGDLEIGKNPTGNQNKYLVLRFNFSKVAVSEDINKLEKSFKIVTFGDISSFIAYYKDYFGNLSIDQNMKPSEVFENIVNFVKANELPPIYLIIDEYDNFTNQLVTNHHDQLYKSVTDKWSWLQAFFKVIKAGVESGSIGKVYITGVLPITMDDLTSGFNIAEFVTLNPQTIEMLGFTQAEIEELLQIIFSDYGFDQNPFNEVKDTIKSNYNGYCFSTKQTNLVYNSTLVNYFLKNFIEI